MNGIAFHRKLCTARDRIFSRAVAGSFASCGAGTLINLPIHIDGERRISLGRDVRIGPSCWLLALGATGRVEIGDRTAISGHCVFAAAEHVKIGASVLIARGVFIADTGHDVSRAGLAVRDSGLSPVAVVRIGDGCWLGQNVVILPGVTLGAGAVIGANSVVRDDVPDGAVAVGAPARIVGRRGSEPRPSGPTGRG